MRLLPRDTGAGSWRVAWGFMFDTVCTVLILTRRAGENIVVGDDIVISVMEVRGDAVRIGIQAPRTVTVHREEVYRELQRANRAAAQSAAATDDALAAQAQSLASRAAKRGQDAATESSITSATMPKSENPS